MPFAVTITDTVIAASCSERSMDVMINIDRSRPGDFVYVNLVVRLKESRSVCCVVCDNAIIARILGKVMYLHDSETVLNGIYNAAIEFTNFGISNQTMTVQTIGDA